MKLRHKVTVVGASLVSSMAFIILLMASLNGIYREKKEAEIKQIEATKHLFLNITEKIEEKKTIFNTLASQVNIEKVEHSLDKVEKLLIQSRIQLKSFSNFSLYKTSGKKLIDLNRIGVNQVYKEEFLTQFYNKDTINFVFVKNPETNEQILLFGKSISNSDGKVSAVLTAELPTNEINQIISRSFDSFVLKNWLIELIKSDGSILYSNKRMQLKDRETLEYIKLNLENKKNISQIEDSEYLWSFAKDFTNSSSPFLKNFYFVIKVEKKLVYREIYEDLRVYVGVFVIFLVLTSYIIYHGASKMTAPIEEAYLAIKDFGNGNFEKVNNLKASDDEIGTIVNGLKDAATKIDYLISDQANKFRMASLGKMAGNIAHEINSPLHLITNHCKLLMRYLEQQKNEPNELLIEKANKSTQTIYETTRRIALIISGLKSLSREGRLDPFEKVQIQKIISDTMNLCKEALQNKGIQLKVTVPDEEIAVECRSVQLSQVLLNLLNNASDAIDLNDEKWIHIKAYQNHEFLFIKVINSGKKISEEIAKQIFQPYFTTKELGKGTGLGLSISQAILKDHQGDLYIDLKEEYTAFIFKIPLSNSTEIKKAV